jgi:sugar phosphate isomerase/epimerase
MNKIGIRAHDIGKFDAKTLVSKVKELSFDGIQLVFSKALTNDIDFNHIDSIAYDLKGIEIMMLGAYFNMVHPNQNILENSIENFIKHIEIAKKLNTKYIGTETGSLMGSPWGYVKENHLEETLDKVIDLTRKLVNKAKKHDVVILVEGAYNHVAYNPSKVHTILKTINSENLKVTLDLFNFLNINNYQYHLDILNESISLFGDDIKIFHLKDFIIKDQMLIQVSLGEGLMNYEEIIKIIKKNNPNSYLIFEGVTGDQISKSYQYIKSLLERN